MKPKLILVDDSERILEFLSNYLKDRFEIEVFKAGEEVIQFIQEFGAPDLLLSDFYMPGSYSGLELLQELNDLGYDIPALILSGSCTIDMKINCIEYGAYDFIEKPFNPRELEARINRVLVQTKKPENQLEDA